MHQKYYTWCCYGISWNFHLSGQFIIFHQPGFPWNKGISLTKPPFGVRSCDVAIIWPDLWIAWTWRLSLVHRDFLHCGASATPSAVILRSISKCQEFKRAERLNQSPLSKEMIEELHGLAKVSVLSIYMYIQLYACVSKKMAFKRMKLISVLLNEPNLGGIWEGLPLHFETMPRIKEPPLLFILFHVSSGHWPGWWMGKLPIDFLNSFIYSVDLLKVVYIYIYVCESVIKENIWHHIYIY